MCVFSPHSRATVSKSNILYLPSSSFFFSYLFFFFFSFYSSYSSSSSSSCPSSSSTFSSSCQSSDLSNYSAFIPISSCSVTSQKFLVTCINHSISRHVTFNADDYCPSSFPRTMTFPARLLFVKADSKKTQFYLFHYMV